jgi:hypothetical protein
MNVSRLAAAVVALVLAIAIAAVAAAGPREPQLGRLSADGPITLASSRAGVALLQADRLRPGDRVTGVITLTNTGDAAGALTLLAQGVRDRPGANHGRLSSVLRIGVQDLTIGKASPEMTLGHAVPVVLGRLGAHEARSYRVSARFPDTGIPAGPVSGDNAAQGSSVEVTLQWVLTAVEPPASTPAAPATPAAPPAALPVTPAQAPAHAILVRLRIPPQRVIRPRGLKGYAECEVACEVRFTARLDSAPRHGKRRRTLMGRGVLRGERRWHALRPGREQRVFLKLRPRALERLRRQLHRRGRVGITVVAHMRSTAGARTARRRIVMRTYGATAPRG